MIKWLVNWRIIDCGLKFCMLFKNINYSQSLNTYMSYYKGNLKFHIPGIHLKANI